MSEPPTSVVAADLTEDVPSVDAAAALDKLEAAEPMPLLFRLGTFPSQPYAVEKSREPVTEPNLRAEAEALGFRFMGLFSFAALFFMRKTRESWTDASGTTKLSLRKTKSLDPVEATSSRYLMCTLFDDGTMIVTWSKPNISVPAGSRVIDRPGTDDLKTDYASHRKATREHALGGRRALASQDLAMVPRISVWDDSRLRQGVAMSRINLRLVMLLIFGQILWRHFRGR